MIVINRRTSILLSWIILIWNGQIHPTQTFAPQPSRGVSSSTPSWFHTSAGQRSIPSSKAAVATLLLSRRGSMLAAVSQGRLEGRTSYPLLANPRPWSRWISLAWHQLSTATLLFAQHRNRMASSLGRLSGMIRRMVLAGCLAWMSAGWCPAPADFFSASHVLSLRPAPAHAAAPSAPSQPSTRVGSGSASTAVKSTLPQKSSTRVGRSSASTTVKSAPTQKSSTRVDRSSASTQSTPPSPGQPLEWKWSMKRTKAATASSSSDNPASSLKSRTVTVAKGWSRTKVMVGSGVVLVAAPAGMWAAGTISSLAAIKKSTEDDDQDGTPSSTKFDFPLQLRKSKEEEIDAVDSFSAPTIEVDRSPLSTTANLSMFANNNNLKQGIQSSTSNYLGQLEKDRVQRAEKAVEEYLDRILKPPQNAPATVPPLPPPVEGMPTVKTTTTTTTVSLTTTPTSSTILGRKKDGFLPFFAAKEKSAPPMAPKVSPAKSSSSSYNYLDKHFLEVRTASMPPVRRTDSAIPTAPTPPALRNTDDNDDHDDDDDDDDDEPVPQPAAALAEPRLLTASLLADEPPLTDATDALVVASSVDDEPSWTNLPDPSTVSPSVDNDSLDNESSWTESTDPSMVATSLDNKSSWTDPSDPSMVESSLDDAPSLDDGSSSTDLADGTAMVDDSVLIPSVPSLVDDNDGSPHEMALSSPDESVSLEFESSITFDLERDDPSLRVAEPEPPTARGNANTESTFPADDPMTGVSPLAPGLANELATEPKKDPKAIDSVTDTKDGAAETVLSSNDPKYNRTRKPQSRLDDDKLAKKYAAIDSIEERAFQILVDLGMVEVHDPNKEGEWE